jgi:hypothetical protein
MPASERKPATSSPVRSKGIFASIFGFKSESPSGGSKISPEPPGTPPIHNASWLVPKLKELLARVGGLGTSYELLGR